MLDTPMASRLARIALGHVTREYPHGLAHVFEGPGDAQTPRTLHPIFYGSFDWHSCVHAYWLLATLHGRFPTLPEAAAIEALFDSHLTSAHVETECAYLRRPAARGFERPYGWAWVLALQHALRDTGWAESTTPLAAIITARFKSFLPRSTYPVRVGTHFNTAFALSLAAPYARANDTDLLQLITTKAAAWYGSDCGCQAWEPAQDEFLSPALIEAACMRRLLPSAAFPDWLSRFLPHLADGQPETLFQPAQVTDRSDGKIAHLDGLNLSRAWCWQEIASAWAEHHPLHGQALAAARHHIDAALPHLEGDFMGEHWLATFAALALDPSII